MLVADLTAAQFKTGHREYLADRRPETYGILTR